MPEKRNDYSAFVEQFTTIEHQGYDVLDPTTGELRHIHIEGAMYFETGQLDIGIVRFGRWPWWRRALRWLRRG